MPTTLFRSLLALLTLGWVGMSNPAEAQFIRFTISIPAGFEAKPETSSPQVLEPPADLTKAGSVPMRKQSTRWIEFRTRENVQLAITAQFDTRIGGMPTLYFLNNNTTDFNLAKTIAPFRSIVPMYEGPRLMRDFPEETSYLSAWLGIPSDRSGLLTIEFH